MADDRSIVVNLSVNGVVEATEQFDRLTVAIQRAVNAFVDLADEPHGGIHLKMCGDLVDVEIKPFNPVTREVR